MKFWMTIGLILLAGFIPVTSQAVPIGHNDQTNPHAVIQHHLQSNAATIYLGPGSISPANNTNPAYNRVSDALDTAISNYNNAAGVSLNLTRGGDLSGSEATCDLNAIENQVRDFVVLVCPSSVFSDLGVSASVLGLTISEVNNDIISRSVIAIREGLDAQTAEHVIRHELGHLIGLDHTTFSSLAAQAAMGPLLLFPTTALHKDDIWALNQNYPADPTNPTNTFSNGACISGTIFNQDGEPVTGVILSANTAGGSNPERVTTVSGFGYNTSGAPHGPGEYLLCGSDADIKYVLIKKCKVKVGIGQEVNCGAKITTAATSFQKLGTMHATGGDLSIMAQLVLPYVQDGVEYVMTNSGAVQLNSGDNFQTVGDAISLSPGEIRTGIDFVIEAELVEFAFQENFTSVPFFDEENSSCQAVHGNNSKGLDLGLVAILLLPLAFVASRRRLALQKIQK